MSLRTGQTFPLFSIFRSSLFLFFGRLLAIISRFFRILLLSFFFHLNHEVISSIITNRISRQNFKKKKKEKEENSYFRHPSVDLDDRVLSLVTLLITWLPENVIIIIMNNDHHYGITTA